jgi:hypothetical protein
MMKTEAKDCGPLGELATKVGEALKPAIDQLLEANPEMDLVLVLVPNGDVQGAAIMNARKVAGGTLEGAYIQAEKTQTILRNAAESCGRTLYQSPGSPLEVAAESAFIIRESRDAFEAWAKKRCDHAEHGIREAAVFIATGVRILSEIGTPERALIELTRICKEACRRAHLGIAKREAQTHAQA